MINVAFFFFYRGLVCGLATGYSTDLSEQIALSALEYYLCLELIPPKGYD